MKPSEFTGIPLKPKEANKSTKHNRVKNSSYREADQLTPNKHDRRVSRGSTEKQLVRAGLEPAASGFQVRRSTNSATLPSYELHQDLRVVIYEFPGRVFEEFPVFSIFSM